MTLGLSIASGAIAGVVIIYAFWQASYIRSLQSEREQLRREVAALAKVRTVPPRARKKPRLAEGVSDEEFEQYRMKLLQVGETTREKVLDGTGV